MDISSLRDRQSQGVFSISELNNLIKSYIDSNRTFGSVSVTGEISNFTDHRSGHLYFSLKDTNAQIKAVMFRSARSRLKFLPSDGMKVTVHGSVSLYPQTGTVQLYVSTMAPDGVGALYKAYEQLKEKLSDEGLFSEEFKKTIPSYPQRIGVITSPTGAAVRDIINVTGRRYPLAKIYLYPSLVQGEGAEQNLIKAVDFFDKSGLVDVVIIGRGGGSIEDLWAFNSEALARRIYAASVPIISAVGHETDFTICDFVADLRAPTPSAAAELSVPDIRDLMVWVDSAQDRICAALLRIAERKREKLATISESKVFSDSTYLFEDKRQYITSVLEGIKEAAHKKLFELSAMLAVATGKTDALSPLSVLSRGYSIVEKDARIVKCAHELSDGDDVCVRFLDGIVNAEVKKQKDNQSYE